MLPVIDEGDEKMGVIINKERCILCGTCVEHCPEDILVIEKNQVIVKYPMECSWCGACEIDCVVNAIKVRFTKQVGPIFIRTEES